MNWIAALLLSLLVADSLSFIPLASSSEIIQVPGEYSRIQTAIDAADPGDTVRVATGTYFESIRISKSLRLIGEGPEEAVIVGNGTVVDVNADNVEIRGFTVRNGTYGIFLYYCTGALLRNNVMSSNKWNFGVWGDSISHFVHDVDSSNTVDGKPVYFWVNENNKSVPKDAGYVALISSTNITAENLVLTSNEQGVLLVNTQNSTIRNVAMSGNDVGIDLRMSSTNTVTMNCLSAINWLSIYLTYSNSNTVTENTIHKGNYGISATHSSGNKIYHNNFIDNKVQQYQVNCVNEWNDDGEGNYWSDYTGVDSNEDGVGDTMLPHLGVDHYPLVHVYDKIPPVADAGEDQTVFKDSAAFFDASGSSDNTDLASYVWDFGDGSSGTGINVNHTYTTSGVYNVTLTVTDLGSNTAENTALVTVVEPPSPLAWWASFATLGVVAIILVTLVWLRRSAETKGIKNKS